METSRNQPQNAHLRIGFVGAGVVGRSLAMVLSQRGYSVTSATSLSVKSAEALAGSVAHCRAGTIHDVQETADLIFLTVPDDQIEPVAARLAQEISWRTGQAVVHCSGALSLDVLRALDEHGVAVGSFHPLQSLACVEDGVLRLPGSYFGVEADEPLRSTLSAMVRALGGHLLLLPGHSKARYHLAATIASNYVVTLFAVAVDLLGQKGITPAESASALLPLLRGTVDNLAQLGLPRALTGPIARGDLGTIHRHLEVLRGEAPGVEPLYRHLGAATVPLAMQKGALTSERAARVRQLLNGTERA
ncbi:MAG TPA: Rossmann-like and DUF2520 domain-containing protein [Methylomirabilota bacterium]|nr:Rossmann-like and DUF2520 domain-containing protein [Methylomirabilota bacterium]